MRADSGWYLHEERKWATMSKGFGFSSLFLENRGPVRFPTVYLSISLSIEVS